MPSSRAVLERMDQRVAKLTDGFDGYVRVFGKSERFTGPSGYFHRKTLARRAQHQDIASLLDDDGFFDALYATLTAWGMHRMGPGNTRLRDLAEIRDSIRAQVGGLQALASRDITTVNAADGPKVIEQTWLALTALRVSVAEAQIVANSKALHHLLPALVPPMDRNYTYRFFYGRQMLSIDERAAFGEIFSRLLNVAATRGDEIRALLDNAWNSSPAKVVDNAVVGYLSAEEGAPPPAESSS
jgi:hypothetical protein